METQTTDTQTVSLTGSALASVLGPVLAERKEAYAQPAKQEAPAATAQEPVTPPAAAPVAEAQQPAATQEPAAPVAPAAPAAPATPEPAKPAEPVDPYAAVVGSIVEEPKPALVWSDEAKALYKQTFGVEDPLAHKAEIERQFTQAELLKKQLDEVTPIKQGIDAMPPAMQRAIQLALSGNVTEAQDYLKSLPKVALENKEAKDLDDRSLIDTYLPSKIKPEQWAMLTDPEADPDVVDALKTRIGILRDSAADVHDNKRTEIQRQYTAQQEANQKAFENYQQGIASTIANAKNSPLRAFLSDDVVSEIQTGNFLGKFVQQDGVTPTPDAATLYLRALHFEGSVKAAEARGYERGKQEALLEATSRQPAMPRGSGRDIGDTPKGPMTQQDQINQVLLRVHQGV